MGPRTGEALGEPLRYHFRFGGSIKMRPDGGFSYPTPRGSSAQSMESRLQPVARHTHPRVLSTRRHRGLHIPIILCSTWIAPPAPGATQIHTDYLKEKPEIGPSICESRGHKTRPAGPCFEGKAVPFFNL